MTSLFVIRESYTKKIQTFGFLETQLRIAAFLTWGKPERNPEMAQAQQYLYHCEHLYAYGL